MNLSKPVKMTITAAVLVMAAVICALIVTGAVFNNEAALCAYLSGNGVDADALIALIDEVTEVKNALSDAFLGGENFDDAADRLWALIETLDSKGDILVGAAHAYQNAPAVGNPFALLNYLDVATSSEVDMPSDSPMTAFTDIEPTARELVNALGGVTAAGKAAYDKAIETAYDIATAEDVNKEVAYRDIIETALYAIEVTSQVDFSQLTLLDALTYDGFCSANAAGIHSAVSTLRALTYDDLLELSGYLPQKTDFSLAVCNFAAAHDADFGAVGALLFDILDIVCAEKDVTIAVGADDISDALKMLGVIPASGYTDAQYAQAAAATQILDDAFADVIPDIGFFE